MRVGNLMPGEVATVRLTLTGPLALDAGEATFRFPLVVAPRYIPGQPLPGASVGSGTAEDTDAVPDASRITPPVLLPGYPNPVRLSLTAEVRPGGLKLSGFRSSLHTVMTESDEKGNYRFTLQPGERLNRDFILRFRIADEHIRSNLLLYPDQNGNAKSGTFALTLVPPQTSPVAQKPRDVVFVLDRSGSMSGWKMVTARRALGRLIDTLTAQDRFTVYAFDDTVEEPAEANGGFLEATDRQRFRAIEFLAKVDARGGTELAQPLSRAVQQLATDGDRDRVLVLLTDGQVGNEDQILRNLGKRVAGLRIFTLGIDQAVNEAFLKRLATLGGGFCEVVESEDRLDEVMHKLQRRIEQPLLSGLKMEAVGFRMEPQTVVPGRLPDLSAGAPVVVLGRYQGVAEGAVTLSGQDNAGRAWSETVASRVSGNRGLCWAWARAYLRELEDRFVIGSGDVRELEKQIVATSLQYGVLCRFTAFVAVDRTESVNEGGQQHKIVQPVDLPAGWEHPEQMRGIMLACLAPMPCAAPAVDYDEETESVDSCLMDFSEEENSPPVTGELMPPSAESPPPPAGKPIKVVKKLKDITGLGLRDRSADDSKAGRGKSSEVGKSHQPAPGPRKKNYRAREERAGGPVSRKTMKALEDAARAPAEPVHENLSAYRRRAAEMVEALNRGGDRPHTLGVLSVQLAALVEDLESVGAEAAVLEPLQKLLAELRQLVQQKQPAEADMDRLWGQAQAFLRQFAAEPAAFV
jgi:Ca-activated chloride channel family protein